MRKEDPWIVSTGLPNRNGKIKREKTKNQELQCDLHKYGTWDQTVIIGGDLIEAHTPI